MSAAHAVAAHSAKRQAPVGLFQRLADLVRPWRWLLTVTACFVLVSALLELVPPLIVQRIIDHNIASGRTAGLLFLAVLYLLATAGVQATTFLYGYLAAVVAQNVLHVLRVRLFGHLQQLPMTYYDRTPLGDTISRCTADVETVDTLFSSGVASLVAETTRMVTVGIAMVVLSPLLFLIACCIAPPLAFLTRYLQVRVRDAERANRRAVGLLNTHLQETLTGIEVVRAFGAEPLFVARFRAALRQTLLAFNRSTFYNALYPPITGILASVATALLLWFGARNTFASLHVSLGTLTAFVLLFQRFFTPLINLGDQWQTVQSAFSGVERIFEVLDQAPEDLPTREPSAAVSTAQTAIDLRIVEFGYLPGHPVLRRVSLQVQRGEHVALVGRTGAGKSSTLHLLGGLYEPWSGTVRVAGCDPRALGDNERRQVLGVVPQVVQLFTGTVLDNLTLHDATASRSDVERATTITGLDAVIQSLPQGYDTPLSGAGRGEGAQLSAGQRQLLALARALVWNPAVLLFDEATAAIDGASDAAFREALRTAVLARGCAVLTVAHRLATAREADRVIVMEAGRIVEEGTPRVLAGGTGRFAALLELEAAGWDWQAVPLGEPDNR
ncbi:MAG: ABC transporter ATP-binding protein [Dehalococcoidia bacterium]